MHWAGKQDKTESGMIVLSEHCTQNNWYTSQTLDVSADKIAYMKLWYNYKACNCLSKFQLPVKTPGSSAVHNVKCQGPAQLL